MHPTAVRSTGGEYRGGAGDGGAAAFGGVRSVSPTPETTVTIRHQIEYCQREFPSFAAGCAIAAMRRIE